MVETIYGADGFFCGPPGDWNIDGTVNTARNKLTELSEFRTKEIFWVFSKQAVCTVPPVRALTVPSQHFIPQWSEKAGSEYFYSLPCLLSTSETRHTLNPPVLGGFWLSLSSSLVPGMQNQMPAVIKGKLTFDFENALMLLTNFKRQGWGHTRHMLTTVLWPASLQGALRSSPMGRDISLFFLWRESLLQTAWLIHLHYLILLRFCLLLFITEKSYSQLVFMSTTAGSLWNLQAIQSMCQMEQDKVSDGRKNTCTGCLFPVCCNLWCLAERMPDKKQCTLHNRFHLEESKTFHLLGNIGMILMIPPASGNLSKNKWRLNRSWSRSQRCPSEAAEDFGDQNIIMEMELPAWRLVASFTSEKFNCMSCICHRSQIFKSAVIKYT